MSLDLDRLRKAMESEEQMDELPTLIRMISPVELPEAEVLDIARCVREQRGDSDSVIRELKERGHLEREVSGQSSMASGKGMFTQVSGESGDSDRIITRARMAEVVRLYEAEQTVNLDYWGANGYGLNLNKSPDGDGTRSFSEPVVLSLPVETESETSG